MNITATITVPASGPFNVYKMLTGQAQAGVTVLPVKSPLQTGQSGRGACQAIYIQNDPANTAGVFVYEGDASTASDGSCQGNSLAVGQTLSKVSSSLNAESLINQFVNASAAGVKVNVDVNFV